MTPDETPGTSTMRAVNAGLQRMQNFFVVSIGVPIFLAGLFVLAVGSDTSLGIALVLIGAALAATWGILVWLRRRKVAE